MREQYGKALGIIASIAILVFSFFLLRELKAILIPFFIAIIITFIFEPLYIFLRSKKVPGFAAIILIILIIILIANISSVLVVTSINTFSAELPKYEQKFREMALSIFSKLKLSEAEIQNLNESLKIKNLLMEGSITSTLTGIFSSIIGVFGDFILIIIYIIFLMTELGSIRERINKAYSEERSKKISDIITEIFTDVKKYIVRKTLVNLLQGIIFGTILWIFGVDFYFVWGFMCFFSHYVPNLGPFISTILPGLLAFLQFDNVVTPIIIIILLIVVQSIIGNILEPKFLGDQLDLSPLLLLLSLIFWGYVWGIVGMILSVPIMSMIKITLSKFESTKSVSVLMSYNKEPGVLAKTRRKSTNKI
jgi:AI-2 transport protein TqsA